MFTTVDVNDADHDRNVSTYSEYTREISGSSFPHFECVIIDSRDYMLIPEIPANLTQQGNENISWKTLFDHISKHQEESWKYDV